MIACPCAANLPSYFAVFDSATQEYLRTYIDRSLAVHWVEPKPVAEITYLTWTADNLLRHTVYVGLREDKRAEEVRREVSPAREGSERGV